MSRAIVTALLVVSLWGCSEEKPPEKDIVRPVRVMRVGRPGTSQASFTGVTRSSKEVRLSFRVGGSIDSLNIELGDEVKKGDPVGTLDAAEVSLEVQAAQADLAKAEAQRKRYEADYKRARAMYAQQVNNKAELDAARAFFESASADISAARKALQLAQKRRSYHRLRAPVDGKIAQVLREENENVGAGEPVAVLNAGGRAEAEIAVTDRFIGRIRVGDKAKVTFNSLDGMVMEGVVSQVGVSATEAATTFPVTVRFAKEDERIRSGMTVTATFEASNDNRPTRFFIPPRAVVSSPDGKVVYVAVPGADPQSQATIATRKVEVGRPSFQGVEVKSGLKEGDLIVLAGMSQMSEGLVVRLMTPEEPKGAQTRLEDTFPELDARPSGSAAPSASATSTAPSPEAP